MAQTQLSDPALLNHIGEVWSNFLLYQQVENLNSDKDTHRLLIIGSGYLGKQCRAGIEGGTKVDQCFFLVLGDHNRTELDYLACMFYTKA
jgi:hypothetical protein